MSTLVKPHGATLLNPLLLEGPALKEERQRAKGLSQVKISSREAGDLIMLGIGGFTPLPGFMNYADWEGVCNDMRLADGTFWPIPITLSTDKATADGVKIGADIALVSSEDGDVMATMRITEKYTIDKEHECTTVFKTKDPEHPGVRMVMAQGEVNLAGPVQVLSQGDFPERFKGIYMTPAETRARFTARPATPCTAPTNTWSRSPSRSATGC
jgi:sulfate adenylyltransferase